MKSSLTIGKVNLIRSSYRVALFKCIEEGRPWRPILITKKEPTIFPKSRYMEVGQKDGHHGVWPQEFWHG